MVYSVNERVDIWFCFEGAVATTFGQGIGPVYLDEVTCIGNETSLAECEHQGVSSHDCYSSDAGVICPGEYYISPPHLSPPPTHKQAGSIAYSHDTVIFSDLRALYRVQWHRHQTGWWDYVSEWNIWYSGNLFRRDLGHSVLLLLG